MCSETSPRFSFSNDLSQEDHDSQNETESRRDTRLLDSSSCDFEFSICSSSINDESSLADELFSDGMILPFQVIRQTPTHNHVPKQIPKGFSLPPLPGPSSAQNSKKDCTKEIVSVSSELAEKTHQSKSFWGFKRSSSLNCDIKKSLICSLPLLSRSNSTGSVPNSKRTSLKDVQNKQSSQKQQQSNSATKSSASSYYVYSLPHKPPLKKSYGGSYGNNGVRISPVLNVPPPFIPKGTANLFGLGSLLRNGKEKKNKKMMVQ